MGTENSFLTSREVRRIGFAAVGRDVMISRRCSIHRPERIRIGDGARIDDFAILSGGAGIAIGRRVHIAAQTILYGGAGIEIGDHTLIAARCVFYSRIDDFSGRFPCGPWIADSRKPQFQVEPITIGRHCLIGVASTIFPSVRMAEGSALGAHSLLKTSTKPFEIHAGVPARRIGKRSRAFLRLLRPGER